VTSAWRANISPALHEATPVTEAYRQGQNRFTGRIDEVTVELKDLQSFGRIDPLGPPPPESA